MSNNQDEYETLILGLKWAWEVGVKALEVFNDSQVIVEQVNCEYSMNSDNLKGYAEKVDHLIFQFQHFALKKIDGSQNEMAFWLAKIALGESPNNLGITIELLSTQKPILPLRASTGNAPTWIDELREFIVSDIFLEEKINARQIQK